MNKNILITGEIPEIARNILEKKGFCVDINHSKTIPDQKKIIKLLKKKSYDAVISFLTDKIDGKIFDASPNTKIYVNYASGFDNINLPEAKKRGITIANSPAESSAEAVAEHTIALMLGLAARIVEADLFVRKGKFKGWDPMNFIGTDILGKTLGLIGAGRIGYRVAHYSKSLGVKIIYYDISRNEKLEKDYEASYVESIDELLKASDVVSLHIPLMSETRHLINETSLKLMKRTAFLINTSRGPIIDEKALAQALKNKTIAGAGLDVFEFEPKINPLLLKLPNVILTPHIASASVEARNEMAEIAVNNVIDFFEGRTPRNIVSK